jgi:hypothetical protein
MLINSSRAEIDAEGDILLPDDPVSAASDASIEAGSVGSDELELELGKSHNTFSLSHERQRLITYSHLLTQTQRYGK